jgi:hypothetical protein
MLASTSGCGAPSRIRLERSGSSTAKVVAQGLARDSTFGGAPHTNFALSPKDIVGAKSDFQLGAVVIGAYIHFWQPGVSIGTVVGAGPALAAGAFGGSGTWSAA